MSELLFAIISSGVQEFYPRWPLVDSEMVVPRSVVITICFQVNPSLTILYVQVIYQAGPRGWSIAFFFLQNKADEIGVYAL